MNDISEEDFFEVIVVGGGTCGLSVSARLCENLPGALYTEDEHQRFHWLRRRQNDITLVNRRISSKRKFVDPDHRHVFRLQKAFSSSEILVLDEVSDKFMGQWDNQFATCRIPFLRSPMFFHVDPANIDGLISYANMTKREGEDSLKKIDGVVGKEYSKHQNKKSQKKKSKQGLNPVPSSFDPLSKKNLVEINMRDWRDYYRPSTKLFKDFCENVVDRYNLRDSIRKDSVSMITHTELNIVEKNQQGEGFIVETASGRRYGCKICILCAGHRGKIEYPLRDIGDHVFPEGSCHTSHIFSKEVEFPVERVMDKVTSNQPSSLTIVGGGLTSAQLVDVAVRSGISDINLILRGPLKVKHFDFHLEWVTKYRNVKKAAFYILDSDEERLEMIKSAREGGSMNPEYYKKLNTHIKDGKVKLHTFSKIERQLWNETNKSWEINLVTEMKGEQLKAWSLQNVDYICFATGISPDIENLPFMKNIVQQAPIPTVKGFPCLTDNLQWNETLPLFVLGKYASLRVGPSSANLDGARLGAERIGWCAQEMKVRGELDWVKESLYLEIQESIEHKEVNESDELSSFETRLRLAGGDLNWYSLLGEA